MTLISKIINHNNDSYFKAKKCLTKIKDRLSDLVESYPDVTASEILVIQNVWKSIPEYIGKGVSQMGIEVKENFTSLLSHFENGGEVNLHYHENMYELTKVIKGSITNTQNGVTYSSGETFVIDKKENHGLVANEETYLYTILTTDETLLVTPKIKPALIKAFNSVVPG